jgi:hypothetical protein
MATMFSHYRRRATDVARDRVPVLSVAHASVKRQRKAALHQLSIYGCRLASRIDAAQGEPLTLRFDRDAPIAATVVWCEGGLIGARFDQPIERDVMRALSQRLG